ncbi:MAG: NUDIX hydrolase [Candidatus Binatia bacterium]
MIASKHAATVILLRSEETGGFEVFLTRRPEGMAFLGGMYVFPGGNVRKEDCAAGVIQRCQGLSPTDARRILGAQLTPSLAIGHWIAGIRELYEEAGVLLARRGDGKPAANAPSQMEREALLAKSSSFEALLRASGLFCDLSRVVYFSRWETPPQFSIRFDTRFYLASLPDGEIPVINPREVEDALWLSPDLALDLFNRGELPMIFPTFASLRTLADFERMESVFREYQPSTGC